MSLLVTTEHVPLIPIDMLPSSPLQIAASLAVLTEKFGPHELGADTRQESHMQNYW
jgi:hypothetical protein